MNAIEAANLTKRYKYVKREPGLKGSIVGLFKKKEFEKTAVEEFSFNIEQGEVVGLIGPNGAGKTSLIKMLTGIIQPTEGNATVLGHDPAKLENGLKSKYALVMGQKSQLWWDLPAQASFYLNQAIYDIPEAQFRDKMKFMVKMLDVEHCLSVQVRQLSLGERMKMELISCLLHDPQIIFLDEPTIGLDVTAQKNIRKFLKDVNEEFGVSILLTSHYMEDIMDLCQRVIVINKGKKIYDGNLEQILDSHKEYTKVTMVFNEPTTVSIDHDVDWLTQEPSKIVFRVVKEEMNVAVKKIVSKYDFQDMNIEAEEDLSTLIEKIYRTA